MKILSPSLEKCNKCGFTWTRCTKKQDCPSCGKRVVAKKDFLATIYPELAKEWHSTKNKDLIPYGVTPGSHRKVWWECSKCGYEWEAIVANRTSGRGCPACAGRVATENNCLATIHPKLSKEWHPIKNGGLTPKDVTS
ncbi:MAG: zinc-ribbon domain-containing protein, partial [Candidatus Hodarchaeales archaeon]